MRDWVSLSQFWYQKKLGNFFLFIPPPNRVGGGSYRQGVSKRLLAGSMKFCPGRRVIYLLLKQSCIKLRTLRVLTICFFSITS